MAKELLPKGITLPSWSDASAVMNGEVPPDDLHEEDGYDSDAFLIANPFHADRRPAAEKELNELIFDIEPGTHSPEQYARMELLAQGRSEHETEQTIIYNGQRLYFHKQKFYKIRADQEEARKAQQAAATAQGSGAGK